MTKGETSIAAPSGSAPLLQAGALIALRNAGFDLSTSVGELVDNAYDAGATRVSIRILRDASGAIEEVAVGDDGRGIPVDGLADALSLGRSSRLDARDGLGRFGMGMKLAAFSQARRLEVVSVAAGAGQIAGAYVDLDRVAAGEQRSLEVEQLSAWSPRHAGLMGDGRDRFGTIVSWRCLDGLTSGGRFGMSIDERLHGLRRYLARTFRRFIDGGLTIELDGDPISLHDPLFLLENQKVARRFPEAGRAEIVDWGRIDVDGHDVRWTVTLLPERFRSRQPEAALAARGRGDFSDLHIPENEGRVSFLRNGREVQYDVAPGIYPGQREGMDRFIGVEVEFAGALDEYFQVRSVKRGAEPIPKLREELRKVLEGPIGYARRRIREHWRDARGSRSQDADTAHWEANQIAADFARTAPVGRAAVDTSAAANVDLLAEEQVPPSADAVPDAPTWLRDRMRVGVPTLLDGSWVERDLLKVEQVEGCPLVRLNADHPFVSELLFPLREMTRMDPSDVYPAIRSDLLKRLVVGLDLLMLAYGKAESMNPDAAAAYAELRAWWGTYASGMISAARDRSG